NTSSTSTGTTSASTSSSSSTTSATSTSASGTSSTSTSTSTSTSGTSGSSGTTGSSSGATVHPTPRMGVPDFGGQVAQEPWSDGLKLVLRDNSPGSAGDLVTFLWFNGTLVPYASQDLGDTWIYLGAGVTCANGLPRSAAQDASGRVH